MFVQASSGNSSVVLGTGVDISNYSAAAGTWYSAPSDGYLNIGLNTGSTGLLSITMKDKNGNGDLVVVATEYSKSVITYVKKGFQMQKRATTSVSGNHFVTFYPLQ